MLNDKLIITVDTNNIQTKQYFTACMIWYIMYLILLYYRKRFSVMTNKEKKNNLILISWILLSLFLSLVCQWFVQKNDSGYTIIILPAFLIGVISAIAVYFLIGIKEKVMCSRVPFYMIPTFLVLMFTRLKHSRISSDVFGVDIAQLGISKYFLKENLNTEKFSIWKPMYGFATEYLFGLIATLAIIILIIAIKNKTIKELFYFKSFDLLYLLIPLGISYVDALATGAFYINQNAIGILTEKASKWQRDLLSFSGATMLMFFIFVSCAVVVYLIIKRIEFSKWVPVTCAVISGFFGVFRLTLLWLFTSSIDYENPNMLGWLLERFTDYNYQLTIMMAIVFAISLRGIIKKELKLKLHTHIGDNNGDKL